MAVEDPQIVSKIEGPGFSDYFFSSSAVGSIPSSGTRYEEMSTSTTGYSGVAGSRSCVGVASEAVEGA